ncbi:hypothetical protein J4G37_34705, partial [Microvirga sp. 3-52]|nr:hypothetical protein [Microvirga sp. 3-52]
KILLKKLAQYDSMHSIPENALPFKEDTLLHMKIVELNEQYRVPFILSFDHDLNHEQISFITGESTIDVASAINTSSELLGEKRKSFELLKKSYHRIPITFKVDQAFGSIDQQPVIKSNKKSVFWPILGVLALGLLLISVPLSLPNKKDKSTANATEMESFIVLEEKYKTERAKRKEKLKLEDSRFDQLNFIRQADNQMKTIKDSLNRGEIPENIDQQIANIIEDIKLPSEMIADIQQEPLHESESASIDHVMSYREKIENLITMYNAILWDNRETIEGFEGGAQKASLLMLSRDKFPRELQDAIDTMRSQSIQLCAKNKTFEINACYYKSSNHDLLGYSYHENARTYFGIMTYDYYLNHANMVYSPDWISRELTAMQPAVIQINEAESYYKDLESYFVSFFYEMMKGNDLIDEMKVQGIVPIHFQHAWGNFYYPEEALPISYLVEPIVKEMEA